MFMESRLYRVCLVGMLLSPIMASAGTLTKGLILMNATGQNFKLTQYDGDAAFRYFVAHRLIPKLADGRILPKQSSSYPILQVKPVEDLWDGSMRFESIDSKSPMVFVVKWNGAYAPQHGRGVSCIAQSKNVGCGVYGGWPEQKAQVQIWGIKS